MTKLTDPLALNEIKLLQAVILKHDDIRSQIIGWCVALVTALSVAFLSKPVNLSRPGFLLLGITVVALFFSLEVIHKVAQDRAISRSRDVEAQIRGQMPYDGPLIADSLTTSNSFAMQVKAANNVRVWAPFGTLLFIVLVVAFG